VDGVDRLAVRVGILGGEIRRAERGDVAALQRARDEGVERPDELARAYLAGTPERQEAGARYLRENIKYYLGDDERTGLETFYRYAVEAGLVVERGELRFFQAALKGCATHKAEARPERQVWRRPSGLP